MNPVKLMRSVAYFEQIVHKLVSEPIEGIDVNELMREFNTLKTEIQMLNAAQEQQGNT